MRIVVAQGDVVQWELAQDIIEIAPPISRTSRTIDLTDPEVLAKWSAWVGLPR